MVQKYLMVGTITKWQFELLQDMQVSKEFEREIQRQRGPLQLVSHVIQNSPAGPQATGTGTNKEIYYFK